ncbi:MAG: hypothetical protein F6J90_27430 [Moorea sp. SIOASIH]|uniref:hypothetical protein n=1 Tax=Moorena sp. SIOASIH TaxID=2607817 RepID=UPI0013BA4E00|nr:hypothetical protein [Moorena sp. SIOASIH]NEO39863.1 hypothetical protein [Moorena sp. SIOASIH]
MKIENLENLQEITIEKLSSVEGGQYAFFGPYKPEPPIRHQYVLCGIVTVSIDDFDTPELREFSTKLFPNKGEKEIPLRNSRSSHISDCYVVNIL